MEIGTRLKNLRKLTKTRRLYKSVKRERRSKLTEKPTKQNKFKKGDYLHIFTSVINYLLWLSCNFVFLLIK